jgi:coproporphyrinogen III oxidase
MKMVLPTLEIIARQFEDLQNEICTGLEAVDSGHPERGAEAKFQEDNWKRSAGGGGRSRIIQDGRVIEKGGVNFSHVHGQLPARIADALGLEGGLYFDATGVSIVLHSSHPHVPIIHMNVRYFEVEGGRHWFGGGIDVSPIYVDVDQAVGFHRRMKGVCDAYLEGSYSTYKAWCDRYFHLKHRQEARGIGGIFFDHLHGEDATAKAAIHAFQVALGRSFVPAYRDFVEAGIRKPYGQRELEWQALRRSRYVEFNLLWDKGTRFGLDTDGRTESILMSMPPMARWVYNHTPEAGSPEAATLALLQPTDWLGLEGGFEHPDSAPSVELSGHL